MIATNVTLTLLTEDDREQFILDNQYAFKFGAVEEFGNRDDHLDGDGEDEYVTNVCIGGNGGYSW